MDVYCKHKSQIIKCRCTIINGIIQKTIIIQDLLLNTSRCCRDTFSDKPEWVMFCFLWGFLGVCSGKSNKSSHPPAYPPSTKRTQMWNFIHFYDFINDFQFMYDSQFFQYCIVNSTIFYCKRIIIYNPLCESICNKKNPS